MAYADIDFSVLEAGKSKVRMLADLVPGEDSLPFLQTAVFLLYPHIAEKEREHSGLSISSYKGTNPAMGAPPL